MPALGVTDRNSVAGLVRAMVAAEQVYAQRASDPAYRRLPARSGRRRVACSSGPRTSPPGAASPGCSRSARAARDPSMAKRVSASCTGRMSPIMPKGWSASLVPELDGPGETELRWMADMFGHDRGHVCLTHQRRPERRACGSTHVGNAARRYGLDPLATGDVLYHHPDRRMLQDVVTAIREKRTIDALGFKRERSADRCLHPPQEMARRFAAYPEALAAVEAIVERCTFSLRDLKDQYLYPEEVVMSGQIAAKGAGEAGLARARQTLRRAVHRRLSPPRSPRSCAWSPSSIMRLISSPSTRSSSSRAARNLVPGTGQRGQFGDLLRARHHLDRPGQTPAAVRALHFRGAAPSRPTSTSISSMSGARR